MTTVGNRLLLLLLRWISCQDRRVLGRARVTVTNDRDHRLVDHNKRRRHHLDCALELFGQNLLVRVLSERIKLVDRGTARRKRIILYVHYSNRRRRDLLAPHHRMASTWNGSVLSTLNRLVVHRKSTRLSVHCASRPGIAPYRRLGSWYRRKSIANRND